MQDVLAVSLHAHSQMASHVEVHDHAVVPFKPKVLEAYCEWMWYQQKIIISRQPRQVQRRAYWQSCCLVRQVAMSLVECGYLCISVQHCSRMCRVPRHCPEVVFHLMISCLNEQPHMRPTAADLVQVISDSLLSKPGIHQMSQP